jgi:hypothetical protein
MVPQLAGPIKNISISESLFIAIETVTCTFELASILPPPVVIDNALVTPVLEPLGIVILRVPEAAEAVNEPPLAVAVAERSAVLPAQMTEGVAVKEVILGLGLIVTAVFPSGPQQPADDCALK